MSIFFFFLSLSSMYTANVSTVTNGVLHSKVNAMSEAMKAAPRGRALCPAAAAAAWQSVVKRLHQADEGVRVFQHSHLVK